jgi:hypothetical protein
MLAFLQNSVTNHTSYVKISDDTSLKHFYVIQFEGLKGRSSDIAIQLQQIAEFNYKHTNISTSLSKDGEYRKINGVILKIKKMFETDKLALQNDVFLSGYSLEEAFIKNATNWDDIDEKQDRKRDKKGKEKAKEMEKEIEKEMEKEIEFQKETKVFCHIFSIIGVGKIHIYENEILLFLNSVDDITRYFSLLMHYIYPNTSYVLTKEEERFIKNNTMVQEMKHTTKLFNYSYATERTLERSYLILDYLQTLPCLYFSLYGSIYILDIYDNLKKVGELGESTDEVDPIIDQGFYNIYTNLFTSIEDVKNQNTQFLLPKTSALVSKNKEGEISIYTPVGNIYIDEIIDDIFIRQSYRPSRKLTTPLFSRVAMDSRRITGTKNVIRTLIAQKDVRRFCKDLDIDYLLNMPATKQKMILQECKKIKDSYLATFFAKMISMPSQYDETKPIIIELTDESGGGDGGVGVGGPIVKDKKLALEENLEKEKAQIDVFHNDRKDMRKFNFYSSVTKILDQLKVYAREVEKRVHKAGSITNAWMKCWEMIHTFNLVPIDHPETFTIFCNAEFPGAFILALNHYIKTQTNTKKYEWYANSLWPGDGKKETLKDSFKLYDKYPNRWLMNEENGGSVLDPKMIKIIEDRLADKVDLYTSDIGIGAEFNEEEAEAPLNLGQVICGLKTLKEGGTMVCKMFLFFKPFNMSLLRLLCNVFKHFYVTKPMASRGGNSEIYIIGKGYKKDQDVIDTLMQSLKTWNKTSVNTYITPITEDFYVKLVYALYYIYGRQLVFLKKNMDIVKATYNYFNGREPKYINPLDIEKTTEGEEFKFRKQLVEIWKNKFPVPPLSKADDL